MNKTKTTAQLVAEIAVWTERRYDARRRGNRELVAGCTRNLRAIERELTSRKENKS